MITPDLEGKKLIFQHMVFFSLFKEICQNDEILICQRFRVGLIDRKYREMRGRDKNFLLRNGIDFGILIALQMRRRWI